VLVIGAATLGAVAEAITLDQVRARIVAHGYHIFLRPDRPSGWWVTIRNGDSGTSTPVEAHAPTRDEALLLAQRLFVNHRLAELDAAIRHAGLTPPLWASGGQDQQLDALQAFWAQQQPTDVGANHR
jgi:hypothetical protein